MQTFFCFESGIITISNAQTLQHLKRAANTVCPREIVSCVGHAIFRLLGN